MPAETPYTRLRARLLPIARRSGPTSAVTPPARPAIAPSSLVDGRPTEKTGGTKPLATLPRLSTVARSPAQPPDATDLRPLPRLGSRSSDAAPPAAPAAATPADPTPTAVDAVFRKLARPGSEWEDSGPSDDDVPDLPPAATRLSVGGNAPAGASVPTGSGLGGLSRAAIMTPRREYKWSDEQQAVINCKAERLVVDAFAGCAKTSTSIGYAEARPRDRILYLCLNTANAEEARTRFSHLPNVSALTTHSVAWRAMGVKATKVAKSWKPMVLMDQLGIPRPGDARVAMHILKAFFSSDEREITERHAEQAAFDLNLSEDFVRTGLVFARQAWARMSDPSDPLQMPHDAYLKMFALSAPQLPYDGIIFDEAQDANPVTLQILQAQPRPWLLAIGDRHQSIYQFRGSINAMERLSADAAMLHLSQTWRFGQQTADLANTVLRELKGETVPIRGMGTDGPWNPDRMALLARTNATLFKIAAERAGEGCHWVGGAKNYRLDLVLDAYHLFAGERDKVRDPLIQRKFASWDDYVRYGDESGDAEVGILTKVIEQFTHETPRLIDDILRNEVRRSEDAAITLTTAHKSKGLEWPCVQIGDDFKVLEEAESFLRGDSNRAFPEGDVNLLYVAMTRAQSRVKLNAETEAWLADLPRHQAARDTSQREGRHRNA